MFRFGMRVVAGSFSRLHVISLTNKVVPLHTATIVDRRSKLQQYSTNSHSTPHKFDKSVIDHTRLASYDEIVNLPDHPNVLLIDVREPSELSATGQIPTSVNIPLKHVCSELQLTPSAFESKYGRKKPSTEDPIIFYCRIGVRSGNAAHEAEKLGFKRVKNYVGSWLEYAEKQGLPT